MTELHTVGVIQGRQVCQYAPRVIKAEDVAARQQARHPQAATATAASANVPTYLAKPCWNGFEVVRHQPDQVRRQTTEPAPTLTGAIKPR